MVLVPSPYGMVLTLHNVASGNLARKDMGVSASPY